MPSGLDDELNSILTAHRAPSLGERAASAGRSVLGGIGAVVGAPKRAVDSAIRWQARNLYGVDVPDSATAGSLLRSEAGLNPEENPESAGYGGRTLGFATEFLGDTITDPLTAPTIGLGPIARGGGLATRTLLRAGADIAPEAAAALERAAAIGRVAAPAEKAVQGAFGALMAHGAVEGGIKTYEDARREGWSPEVAEDLLGTAVTAGMAGHIAHGLHEDRKSVV